MNLNREIYTKNYSEENYRLNPTCNYDNNIINLRFEYIKRFGYGKDVLDLCCGSGSYLIPVVNNVKSITGVDFSPEILTSLRKSFNGEIPENVKIEEQDATNITLLENSFDFVFSYSALYTIPNLNMVIKGIQKVLKKGGYAVLDLGNLNSLNTIVCDRFFKENGWARLYTVSLTEMNKYFREANLEIIEDRIFQILPLIGVPKSLRLFYPILTPYWKKILGIKIGNRMLDEWISGIWPIKYLAFRHIFILKKL